MTGTEKLRLALDALAFYAEEKNWESPSSGFALQYDPEPSPINNDRGKRARGILEEGNKCMHFVGLLQNVYQEDALKTHERNLDLPKGHTYYGFNYCPRCGEKIKR